ncbi:hypothetical protein D1823_20875 (plasmid) [Ruegeria sp. AD91A]|nr:hypothetical protein D1823_20875 [Ruegeria sp. AD91A]
MALSAQRQQSVKYLKRFEPVKPGHKTDQRGWQVGENTLGSAGLFALSSAMYVFVVFRFPTNEVSEQIVACRQFETKK